MSSAPGFTPPQRLVSTLQLTRPGTALACTDASVRVEKVAAGRRGVVYAVNDDYAVKFNCDEHAAVLTDMCAKEVQMGMLLWHALVSTQLCNTVVQPLGTQAVPSGDGRRSVAALAMELLRGVAVPATPTAPACVVTNLRALLLAHLHGALPASAFDSHFRAALFQTLYTLALVNTVFSNKLRLNDCHSGNVGVTAWHAAAGYEVLFPVDADADADADGAAAAAAAALEPRHFVVPCSVRAALLDFGYAALCGDCDAKDARFCKRALKTGMSSSARSRVYDGFTLMFSLYVECRNERVKAHARAVEFCDLYHRVCGDVHRHRLFRDARLCARLPMELQRAYETSPAFRAELRLQTPLDMLRDEYFAAFRAADTAPATVVFGLRRRAGDAALPDLEALGACSRRSAAAIAATLRRFRQATLPVLAAPTDLTSAAGARLVQWLGAPVHWLWCTCPRCGGGAARCVVTAQAWQQRQQQLQLLQLHPEDVEMRDEPAAAMETSAGATSPRRRERSA